MLSVKSGDIKYHFFSLWYFARILIYYLYFI